MRLTIASAAIVSAVLWASIPAGGAGAVAPDCAATIAVMGILCLIHSRATFTASSPYLSGDMIGDICTLQHGLCLNFPSPPSVISNILTTILTVLVSEKLVPTCLFVFLMSA